MNPIAFLFRSRLCRMLAMMLLLHLGPGTVWAADAVPSLLAGTEAGERLVTIQLVGVAEYAVTERFHRLIIGTPGVLEVRRVRMHLDPDHPAVNQVQWQVRTRDMNLWLLESDLYRRLREVTENPTLDSKASRPLTDMETAVLNRICPWQASAGTLIFGLEKVHPDHCWAGMSQNNIFAQQPGCGFE